MHRDPPVSLARQVHKVPPDPRVLRVRRGPQVLEAIQGLRAPRVIKDPPVSLARLVLKEQQDPTESQVQLDLPDLRVTKARPESQAPQVRKERLDPLGHRGIRARQVLQVQLGHRELPDPRALRASRGPRA